MAGRFWCCLVLFWTGIWRESNFSVPKHAVARGIAEWAIDVWPSTLMARPGAAAAAAAAAA